MNPFTGQTFTRAEFTALPATERAQLVEVKGSPAALDRLSRAAAHYSAVTGPDKARRRAANKAARKSRRHNRR
jgi:hypothetical protein